MRGEKRPFPWRVVLGGLLGAVLAPALVCFGWGSWIGIGEGMPVGAFGLSFLVVFRSMASAFGSAEAAAIVQSLLGALLGGVVTVATLPFAEDGKTLVKRSLLHYLATEAAFSKSSLRTVSPDTGADHVSSTPSPVTVAASPYGASI